MADDAGAPDAIEITPEMIEAGAAELWRHPLHELTEEEAETAVKAVFIAMLEVRVARRGEA